MKSMLLVSIFFFAVFNFMGCSRLEEKGGKQQPIDFKIDLPVNNIEMEQFFQSLEENPDFHLVLPDLFKLEKDQEVSKLKNKLVLKWVRYFLEEDSERFNQFIDEGRKHKNIIFSALNNKMLPNELFALPLIESGYNNFARSRAKAVGAWQFIRSTAKRYGLKVSYYEDQRRDIYSSSKAAAAYLKDLFNILNSWDLALASYNCGEARVVSSIVKGDTRNFWELVRKELLPKETINYVPKFLAAAYILKKMSLIENNEKNFDIPAFQIEKVRGGVSLRKIASLVGSSMQELRKLNPSLRRNRLPFTKGGHELRLPLSIDQSKVSLLAKLTPAKSKKRGRRNNYYIVKSGESWFSIAKKFGQTVNFLKSLNGLKRNVLYRGEKVLVLKSKKLRRYRVKKGDSLYKIAQTYNISIRSLKNRNSLRNSKIFPGQILQI